MATCRRLSHLAKKSRAYLYQSLKSYSTNLTEVRSQAGGDEIIVPYRIERSPTDILKTLASTISKDFTAPNYKYEDDPYLIPASNITKRAFSLSKESGRKAARYFLETYPEFFKMHTSVPYVKAFDPPIIYTEENVSSVEPLISCIADCEVDNAITIYKILKLKEIPVSQEVKQDLLELLCYYNCTQPPPDDYYEERFYKAADNTTLRWNESGMAEELFAEMEKDNRAYSAMISGTSKYHNAEKAIALYDEMKSKGFVGTVHAYSDLISVIHRLRDDYSSRWEFAMRLLDTVRADGLHPDLYTMNAVLEALSKCNWKRCMQMAASVVAEMRNIKIEPSLGTYYYLLLIYYSSDQSNASILHEIMTKIENKELTIRHPSDVSFFTCAMELCWKGFGDKELAYRLHNLLEYRNNCKLLGNALSESQYFKCFFRLLCEKEDIDKLMEIYEKYVPNTYTPEPSVTLAVIQSIHLSGGYRHLPKMCSDVLFFEQTERQFVLETLLEAAGCMKHEEMTQMHLVNMVWNILEKLNARAQVKRLPFDWSGVLLGNFLKTFMNGNDLEKSWSVIKKMKEEESMICGYPDKSCLLKFCELCFEVADFEKIAYCTKYAVKGSYLDFREDVNKLGTQMIEENKLGEKQRAAANDYLQNTMNFEDISDSDSESESSSSDDSSSDDSSSDEEK